MLTRNLDIGILMQDNGEYEIAVTEPEPGFSISFGPYRAGSMYYGNGAEDWHYLEDLHNEIVSWIIMLDEERKAIKEEEGV